MDAPVALFVSLVALFSILVHRPQETHLFLMEFNLRRVCHSDKIQFGPDHFTPHRIADLDVLSR